MQDDLLSGLYLLPGGENLSRDFCNWPVEIQQNWVDEPVAAVLLCGRLRGHIGKCDPMPPMSDVMGDK